MTNTGKILHLTEDRIELASSSRTRGQPVFSAKRRAEGVRVIGAVPAGDLDGTIVFDLEGRLMYYTAETLAGSGTLPEGIIPVAFAAISNPAAGE
jgi:hypothetical protein